MTDAFANKWYRHIFRAMGCEMAVWLETADPATAGASFAEVEALFASNEQVLSRFRADSELSQLNARTGQWVSVSDLLWEVLTLALEMASHSNGTFDPTTLNALEQFGYTASFEQMPGMPLDNPLNGPKHPGSYRSVELDEGGRAVFLPAGLRVDLGGIAKGFTAQQAVARLRSVGACLVDAGGDIAAGTAPHGLPGWNVAISSPWLDENQDPADLCTLWLCNEAVATSGIDFRHWQMDGQLVHHLIDPLSGTPAATDGLTMTVVAEDAAQAEAWATAALVAGSSKGLEAVSEAGLAGLMVTRDGSIIATPRMLERLQLLPVLGRCLASDAGSIYLP